MAARDPRTGQFVPAGAERTVDAAYEDFDIQQVRTELSNNTPAVADTLFEPWHVTEPLGGLQRDELAELVYHEMRVHVASRAAGDAETQGRAYGSLGFDGTSALDDILAEGVETTNVGGVTDIDRRVIDLESEPDILDFFGVGWNQEGDDVNGVGMAQADDYRNAVGYRPLFGRGPVVDRHTDLFLHLWQQLFSGNDQSDLVWDVTLVWDVFARGQG